MKIRSSNQPMTGRIAKLNLSFFYFIFCYDYVDYYGIGNSYSKTRLLGVFDSYNFKN